jgi:alkylation response protein AidB-like acyl-CoA dehydrogenase
VPCSNRLGEEGKGFAMLMKNLARERLCQAVRGVAAAEAALSWTVDYTRARKAFDQTIADFQNTRFKLAELTTWTAAGRALVDRCIELYRTQQLDSVDAAMAKLYATDLHCDVVNDCLQFFGGYGYMLEYPIARAYIDARITRIAGGTAEIMKQIIGNRLFAKP